jgi:hypothetical protein
VSELLSIDPETFKRAFGEEPLAVQHSLSAHPLLTLEALAGLADFLPEALVEHNAGDVPTVLTEGEEALRRVDLSPGEIARGIDSNGCWMVMKEIEHHPDYRDLLNESLDEIEGLIAEREGEMRRRMGFVFLSAPGSVTPTHIDNEHNLLLQVRGSKEMNVGAFNDRDYYEQEVERLWAFGTTRYVDRALDETRTFPLGPGDGVYVPLSAPHFVQNGDEVSISLSITFQTRDSERRGHAYALNARLRRANLSPRTPGESPGLDRAKSLAWRTARLPLRAYRGLTSRG